jgi:ABC-type nitrate/sulfonate/bicarbonate transport system substrate-binding protein
MSVLIGRRSVGKSGRGRWVAVAVVSAVLLLVAACGSGGGSPAGHDSPMETVTVIGPNSDPGSAANLYLADALGYFNDAKVKVKRLDAAGATGVALLTAGQADLLITGLTGGFALVKRGVPVSVIWSDLGGAANAAIAVPVGSSAQSVSDLSGKKVGTIGSTGSVFGFVNLYSNQVADEGGKAFKISSFNDSTTLINAVESGAVDGGGGSRAIWANSLATGKVRLIADTTEVAARTKLLGAEWTAETGYVGIAKNLKAKKEAMTRFLMAMTRANAYLNSHTPEEIAKVLQPDPLFKTLTPQTIAGSVGAQFPFYTPYNGQIPEDLWKPTLHEFTRWDIPTVGNVSDDDAFSYDKIVDMSYLKEAQDRLGPDALAPTGGPTLKSK